MKETINITLCWNDNNGEYTKYAGTTILSILENNQNHQLHFYFICEIYNPKDKDYIQTMINKHNQSCQFISLEKYNDPTIIKSLQFLKQHNTSSFDIGTYYRLFIPNLLPSSVTRCLYIDTDMIITGSLKEVYNNDLKENYIGAIQTTNLKANLKRLNLFKLKDYINSGFLLLDLNKIRNVNLLQKSMSLLQKHTNKVFINPDQDMINVIFKSKIKLIKDKYNFKLNDKNKSQFDNSKIVYHYIADYKPYMIKPCFVHKEYKRLYFYYANQTPWEFKLKRNLYRGLFFTCTPFIYLRRVISYLAGVLKIKGQIKNIIKKIT